MFNKTLRSALPVTPVATPPEHRKTQTPEIANTDDAQPAPAPTMEAFLITKDIVHDNDKGESPDDQGAQDWLDQQSQGGRAPLAPPSETGIAGVGRAPLAPPSGDQASQGGVHKDCRGGGSPLATPSGPGVDIGTVLPNMLRCGQTARVGLQGECKENL